jgi:hypothetical protein
VRAAENEVFVARFEFVVQVLQRIQAGGIRRQ